MNASASSERSTPDQCAVGEFVRARSVPAWSIQDRLHALSLPIETAPIPAVTPTTHPALTMLFEQSSQKEADGTEAIVWVRRE